MRRITIRSGVSHPAFIFRLIFGRCRALLVATALAGLAQSALANGLVPETELAVPPLWLELEGYQPLAETPGPAKAWNDMLEHLRQGFSLAPVMNRDVEAQLNWFVRHPEYLDRVFNRAQRYLPYITDQLKSRGLPLELALLPIVESAFDPFAYSHGRASGLRK
ncbi:MAG: hypothetical protein U5K38_13305 [Woeseiaceae bacterium]|nr:hypothetical protein [Woeseiaceae bacterium]